MLVHALLWLEAKHWCPGTPVDYYMNERAVVYLSVGASAARGAENAQVHQANQKLGQQITVKAILSSVMVYQCRRLSHGGQTIALDSKQTPHSRPTEIKRKEENDIN